MKQDEVLRIIYSCLRVAKEARINDITMDNDHKDGEIILTTDDGKEKQVWVISSKNIVETDLPLE
jgi:hypothetical protein